jgi:hypothetical protein
MYFSAGKPVLKPTMTIASMLGQSLLVFLQVLGRLFWLDTSTLRRWTPTLDSMAVARISKAMEDDVLSPIGPVTRPMDEKLKGVDAP